MRTAFLKAFRWWIISISISIGCTAFLIAEETGSMRPVIIGIAGYGFAYVMGAVWKDLRGRVMAFGIGVFGILTFLSTHILQIFYVLFAVDMEANKYIVWMLVLTIIGLPLMTLIYKKVRR